MNKYRENHLWVFNNKYVSLILTAIMVLSGLIVLLPLSSDNAVGYTMPDDVEWNMDDLVTNSSGAVTGSSGLYYVHEDIEISVNSTLNVLAGETVKFDSGAGFAVYGYLSSNGNNMSMVSFTSNEPSPGMGDWDGISFFNGSSGTIVFTHILYAETGVLVNGTYISPLSYNEFESNVWGVHVINAYCFVYENTFTNCGVLPHPDPKYSVGGGVYADDGSYGSITGNEFNSNIGGARVRGAMHMYIMENTFYDNIVYGIFAEGDDYRQSFVNIIGNTISDNDDYGIYGVPNYELYIDNNNITGNRIGIHIGSGYNTTGGGGGIINNYIAFNTENGIECYGGPDPWMKPYTNIYANDIISNDLAGIYCQDSIPNINDNDFIGNNFGVYALYSEPTILASYFDSNDFAVWANQSDIQITDSEITSSIGSDYVIENDGYITSLNTTFDDSKVVIGDGLSTLEVQWYLHILVINASGPVPSADVTVSDNDNGTWTQDYVSDSQGRVKWIVVTEYIRTLTDWVYYTPHNITVSTDSEVGYEEPYMGESKYVVVFIGPGTPPPPPPEPPLPPVDLEIALLGVDMELSWGASGDDGIGADDVTVYVIYKSESVNGPFIEVDTVAADDSPGYSWMDYLAGDGDPNNYFYIVRARDGDGLEDDNENKVGKFVTTLDEGWNMFSVPLVQSNTTREKVLETIENNYATVQGYHAGKSRPWLHWHRNKPNYFNDVIEIDRMRGYYIDMIIADDLVTVGKVSTQTEIELKSGWNLVGYPCLTGQTVDDALSSISGNYNMVERFDTTTDREVRLNPGDLMEPGLGYWIHATSDCTWVVTN